MALSQVAVVTVAFPATPLLLARARICISASHTKEDLIKALEVNCSITSTFWLSLMFLLVLVLSFPVICVREKEIDRCMCALSIVYICLVSCSTRKLVQTANFCSGYNCSVTESLSAPGLGSLCRLSAGSGILWV